MQDRLGKLIQDGQKNQAKIEEMKKELVEAKKRQDELEEKLNKKDKEGNGNSACGPNMVNVKIYLGGDKESTCWTTIHGVRGLSGVKLCRSGQKRNFFHLVLEKKSVLKILFLFLPSSNSLVSVLGP